MSHHQKTSTPANILVVDDVAIHLALLRAILEQRGHTVIPCTSGAEALELVEESPPSIFLIDILMPDMDGFAFVEELRKRGLAPGVPFLFITGDDNPKNRERANALGAFDYLLKPIDPDAVLSRVEAALAHAKGVSAESSSLPSSDIVIVRRSALNVMEGAWRLTLPEDMVSGEAAVTVTAEELLKRATARVSSKATDRGINLVLDAVPAVSLTAHPELLVRTVATLFEACIVRSEPGGSVRVRLEAIPSGLRIRMGIPCQAQEAARIIQTAQSGMSGLRVEPGETGGVLLIADLRSEQRA